MISNAYLVSEVFPNNQEVKQLGAYKLFFPPTSLEVLWWLNSAPDEALPAGDEVAEAAGCEHDEAQNAEYINPGAIVVLIVSGLGSLLEFVGLGLWLWLWFSCLISRRLALAQFGF